MQRNCRHSDNGRSNAFVTGCSQTQEEIYQIPEDKKLVIYTSHKEDVYEPIIKEFEERTGIL